MVSDEYIYNLMEQGQEAQVVATCENCLAELYSGEEVIEDADGNYFCDEACAGSFHEFNEVIL